MSNVQVLHLRFGIRQHMIVDSHCASEAYQVMIDTEKVFPVPSLHTENDAAAIDASRNGEQGASL